MNTQQNSDEIDDLTWSGTKRAIASVLIVGYLFIVASGPATNSISSDLTNAVGQTMEPVHQAMHLGHGYRFFGNNPGQSHILRFEVGMPDRSMVSGQLPDPDEHWPRLLYHRWFMLSETVFNQYSSSLDTDSFAQTQDAITRQIELMQQKGKQSYVKRLLKFQRKRGERYEQNMKRIEEMAQAIGQHLIRRHGGKWVKLSIHAREIPYPEDVILGEKLGDPKRLSDPLKIWTIEAAE